jgi:hypothetical protein
MVSTQLRSIPPLSRVFDILHSSDRNYRRNFLKNMQEPPIYNSVAEAHNVYRTLASLFALTLILSADTGSSLSQNSNSALTPVASVTGSGPFSINGASLANGVPAWPIMPGDQITTGSTAAVITLPDGTQLDLDPKSQVTITIQNGVVKIFVNSGGCHERNHHPHHGPCWVEPASTSPHRCDRDHDRDDRCCPDF